jgi:hypothetical protein
MTTAMIVLKMFQGQGLAVVGILNAVAALILVLVKLVHQLVAGAEKLFQLWLEVRQERRKLEIVSRSRRHVEAYARRALPQLKSSGRAVKRMRSAHHRSVSRFGTLRASRSQSMSSK